jgi:hypothetical protein
LPVRTYRYFEIQGHLRKLSRTIPHIYPAVHHKLYRNVILFISDRYLFANFTVVPNNSTIHRPNRTLYLQNTINRPNRTLYLQNTIYRPNITLYLQNTIYRPHITLYLQNTIYRPNRTLYLQNTIYRPNITLYLQYTINCSCLSIHRQLNHILLSPNV